MRVGILVRFKDESGNNQSKVYNITNDYCIIGRVQSDIVLADAACSRHHALLYQDAYNRLKLRDLESSNGTFLKKQKVEEITVNPGMEFRIGNVTLLVMSFDPVRAHSLIAPPLESPTDGQDTQPGTTILERPQTEEAEEEVVSNTWPENYRAIPKEEQGRFVSFVDSEGTNVRISLKNLVKSS